MSLKKTAPGTQRVTRIYPDGARAVRVRKYHNQYRTRRFHAYPDCDECDGRGWTKVFRCNTRGGSYKEQCEPCSDRFHSHPMRDWRGKRFTTLAAAAENTFHAKLRDRFGTTMKDELEPHADDVEQIRERVYQRYQRIRERFRNLADRRFGSKDVDREVEVSMPL